MRASIAIVVLVSACGDNSDDSGFAGDYQMVSLRTQQGGCGGAGTSQGVPASDLWFRLEDTEVESGPLVAYYPCHELGSCNMVADLYRSFGVGPDDGWITVVASAIQPPCMLGYRRRVLERVDAMTIHIDDTLAQQIDDTLSGAACSLDEARARKDAMPCVEESVWTAELRMR